MAIAKKECEKICDKLNVSLKKHLFLGGGNHNENYLLETDKGKFVLRIENNPMFKNLKKEYKLLKKLNGEFSPKVYFFDDSKKIIKKDYFIEEFIKGLNPKKVTNSFIKDMAEFYMKLHKIKSSKIKTNSLLKSFKPYYNNFKKYKFALDKNTIKELETLFEKANRICIKNDLIFSKSKQSLLHRDPSIENIFYEKGKIKLIDWEFSEHGILEKEIVNFFSENKLEERQKNLFLEFYKYPKSNSARNRFQILYLLKYCGDIGYSVWRLGLLEKKEIKENKKKRLERLNLDIKRLKSTIKNLR